MYAVLQSKLVVVCHGVEEVLVSLENVVVKPGL